MAGPPNDQPPPVGDPAGDVVGAEPLPAAGRQRGLPWPAVAVSVVLVVLIAAVAVALVSRRGGDDTESSQPSGSTTTSPSTTTEPAPEEVELDGYLVVGEDGVAVLQPDGTRTTVIDEPVAVAFDDGDGGVIYQVPRDRTADSVASGELLFTPPATEEQGTIWHLPRGAETPVPLLTSPDLDRSWVALVDVGTWGGRLVFAFADVTSNPDSEELDNLSADLVIREVDTNADLRTFDRVWGYEWGLAGIGISEDLLGYAVTDVGYAGWTFLDGELEDKVTSCTEGVDSTSYENWSEAGCGYDELDNLGQIHSVLYSETGESVVGVRVVDHETGEEIRRVDLPSSPYLGEGGYRVTLEAWDDVVVVSYEPQGAAGPEPAVAFDLGGSGVGEVLDASGVVRPLSAPLVRPAGVTSPEPDDEDEPPTGGDDEVTDQLLSVDLETAIPDLNPCGPDMVSDVIEGASAISDLDEDGVDELVVAAFCAPIGGNGYWSELQLYGWNGDGIELVARWDPPATDGWPPMIEAVSVDGTVVTATGTQVPADQCHACPGEPWETTWVLQGDLLVPA